MRIKELREKRKIGQRELARMAGIDPGYLCRLEKGAMVNPSQETMRRIAEALKVKVKTLID